MLQQHLQVLLSTSCPSVSEESLIEKVLSHGVKITQIGSFDKIENIKTNVNSPSLLLVIPIFGDNDLLGSHFKSISFLAADSNCIGRKILIILKGDRHVSDEKSGIGTAIRKKLENIFFFSELIYFCQEKLDIDTTSIISEEIVKCLFEQPDSDSYHIEKIAKILRKKPAWDNKKKILDFYDDSIGFSLLYKKTLAEITATFKSISEMEINTLLITNASLSDEMISHPLKIPKVDLSSNSLTLKQIFEIFENPEWISIAANHLTDVQLVKCPKNLKSLYLHKNSIKSLSIEVNLPCKLKEISLYRNKLQDFMLPIDQIEISKINLGANPIHSLSESLKKCRNLKFLGIARTNIKSLPDWLFDMENLSQLDISHIEDNIPKSQLDKLTKNGVSLIKKPKY